MKTTLACVVLIVCACFSLVAISQETPKPPAAPTTAPVRAFIDDEAPGWRALTAEDFAKVNSADDTWSWKDGVLHCTGQPVSVLPL